MFFALMLFGALCILGYIILGHNWNYAASDIDDTFGDMDDYTVLVYDGTIVVDNSQQATLADRIQRKLNQWFNLDREEEATEEEVDAVESNVIVLESDVPAVAPTASQVAAVYREKGALVFNVNTSDPWAYEEGYVFQHGDMRIAILGVHELRSLASLQKEVDKLREYSINRLVVVTDDVSRVAGVKGIDVIICASEKIPDSLDVADQGRYIAYAPERGSVAATVMTGSIVSSKII